MANRIDWYSRRAGSLFQALEPRDGALRLHRALSKRATSARVSSSEMLSSLQSPVSVYVYRVRCWPAYGYLSSSVVCQSIAGNACPRARAVNQKETNTLIVVRLGIQVHQKASNSLTTGVWHLHHREHRTSHVAISIALQFNLKPVERDLLRKRRVLQELYSPSFPELSTFG